MISPLWTLNAQSNIQTRQVKKKEQSKKAKDEPYPPPFVVDPPEK